MLVGALVGAGEQVVDGEVRGGERRHVAGVVGLRRDDRGLQVDLGVVELAAPQPHDPGRGAGQGAQRRARRDGRAGGGRGRHVRGRVERAAAQAQAQRDGLERQAEDLGALGSDDAGARVRALERRLGSGRVPALEVGGGECDMELGPALEHRLAEPGGDLAHRRDVADEQQLDPAVGEDATREVPVLGAQGKADRGEQVAVLGQPRRRATVEGAHVAPALVAQLDAQEVAEQRVVAKPARGGVDGGDHRVVAGEAAQHRGAAAALGHGVGQAAADRLRGRGLEQEAPHGVGEPAEDLAEDVVGHRRVVAGERRDELLGARVVAQGELGQA